MKRIVTVLGCLLLVVAAFTLRSQDDSTVLVRQPGTRTYGPPLPTSGKASEERDFAIMSENAYLNDWQRSPAPPVGQANDDALEGCTSGARRPLPLPGWTPWPTFLSDDVVKEALRLGFYVDVWESANAPVRVVAAFRGTDDWKGDWRSNLRWFLRFVPFIEDQYHFISRKVGQAFTERLSADARYRDAQVIATGHSLGGGLAQHFAYSLPSGSNVPRVSRVFAFDPSPVTGWTSVDSTLRADNAGNLATDRIFEHGEILAYVRLLLSVVYPPPGHAPSVTEIRYNFVRSLNPLASHSMRDLACSLMTASATPAGTAR